MDRPIVYDGSLPETLDFLFAQQATMIGIGWLAQAALGTAPRVAGLAVAQTATASQSVLISQGAIMLQKLLEPANYGSIGANSTDNLMKMGIRHGSTTQAIPWTAITAMTSGQALNVLIEATCTETDGTSAVLPYFNASNPAAPYNGPGNTGASQNTRRFQSVGFTVLIGTAAAAGSQPTPTVSSGYVALAVLTVPYGATTIVTSYIAFAANNPLLTTNIGQANQGSIQIGVGIDGKPVIKKWGTGTITTGAGQAVAFTTPFPNACFKATAAEANSSGWIATPPVPAVVGTNSITANGFNVVAVLISAGTNSYTTSTAFSWEAIGN